MRVALSIIGPDKPGVIAFLSTVLSDHDANIQDTSMTILQEHFAMILVFDCPNNSFSEIKDRVSKSSELEPYQISFSQLKEGVSIMPTIVSRRHVLHLSVGDTTGIVAHVTQVLSRYNANIVDCSTRKNNETGIFSMILDVDIAQGDEIEIARELSDVTSIYSGDVTFQLVDEIDL